MALNAKAIGLKIQQSRLAKGMTQKDLAQALGIARSSVVRWETGRAVPSQVGIPRIAQLLGQDVNWLLEGSGDLTPALQNSEVLRAERQTLKSIRDQVKKLVKGAPTSGRPLRDRHTLDDVIRCWGSAPIEARLIAALLITGNWSYKLKLWNRDVSVDEEILALVGRVL